MPLRNGIVVQNDPHGFCTVYVFGGDDDLLIDQTTMRYDDRYQLGDFISFIENNRMITEDRKIRQLMPTCVENGHLLVQAPIVFQPLGWRPNFESCYMMLGWSPKFNFVEYSCPNSDIKLSRNQVYMVWLERKKKKIMEIEIEWQVAQKKSISEFKGSSRGLISEAPWNRVDTYDQRNRDKSYTIPKIKNGYAHESGNKKKQLIEQLKNCNENYVGLVVTVDDDHAVVWSLALPTTNVIFLFGVRDGLVVGDWIQFNCKPCVRSKMNCLLEGKKFEKIDPLLQSSPRGDTVMVYVNAVLGYKAEIHKIGGAVCVDNDQLGAIEFPSLEFVRKFGDKCVTFVVVNRLLPTESGAAWKFHSILSEKPTIWDEDNGLNENKDTMHFRNTKAVSPDRQFKHVHSTSIDDKDEWEWPKLKDNLRKSNDDPILIPVFGNRVQTSERMNQPPAISIEPSIAQLKRCWQSAWELQSVRKAVLTGKRELYFEIEKLMEMLNVADGANV